MNRIILCGLSLVCAASALAAPDDAFEEPARELPVVQNVDVAVVGGGSAAIAAAQAAAQAGVRVFLAAPRSYLGEDLAGRLHLEYQMEDDPSAELTRDIFGSGTPTPLKVKKALDAALLKNHVAFLTDTGVSDVLKSDDGRLVGIVLANRNGRQAVRAKVVIDATDRATVARLAGASVSPFPAGTYTNFYRVVSGEMPSSLGLVGCSSCPPVYPSWIGGGTWEAHKYATSTNFNGRLVTCRFQYEMKDGSARSFAALEQAARDLTYTSLQLDCADRVEFLPSDFVACSPDCRADGVPNLFVLSALASPVHADVQALAPGRFISRGVRVGVAAAKLARSSASAARSQAGGAENPAPASSCVVREASAPLPAFLVAATGTVTLAAKALPVVADCDVLVAGGGTGGAPAAISAGRHGMKTILCEALDVLGGLETEGRIGNYWYGNICGFTCEIDAGVRATGRVFSQAKAEWYRRECRKAGVEILFGTTVEGVVLEDHRLVAVVVVLPDGTRGAIRCKAAIDSTGNAVLPALAGEPTDYISAEELALQGSGVAPRLLGASYSNTDLGFVDTTDAGDLFGFLLRARRSVPETNWDSSKLAGTRERRRMVGAFFMSPLDVMNGRTYPDTVVQTFSNFDSHGQTLAPAFFIAPPPHSGMGVNLPYRCLLPQKTDGLLVTGLGISAHRDAMPILRMQPDVQNQGYVAGAAAAMAVKADCALREIDVKALQQEMVAKGILKPEVLAMKDSYPYSDAALAVAVKTLPRDYEGLSVLMTDPARALPLLRAAYAAASADARLVYAHVLALLGDRTGDQTLIDKVADSPWGAGWNYRGMGQFGRSVGWMDSYVIALGYAKSAAAVPVLVTKAGELRPADAYSHYRALALAFEKIGDKSAAPALAGLLKLPGVSGHALAPSTMPPVYGSSQNGPVDEERTFVLRELVLARALYNLGDTGGLGAKILRAYAADPRGAYAAHARLVLAARK